jgi:hypothetical protein
VVTGYAGFVASYQRTCPDRACGVGFYATLNSSHFWGIEMRDGLFAKNQFFVKFFGSHGCFLLLVIFIRTAFQWTILYHKITALQEPIFFFSPKKGGGSTPFV